MDKDIPPSSPLKTDRLEALSAAAEASSALSVTSCQSLGVASTTLLLCNVTTRIVPLNERVPYTVDLFNSPWKKSPPWKGCAPEEKKNEEQLALKRCRLVY